MATLPQRTANDTLYVGRGIYDVNEVAHLLRCGRRRVKGWTRPSAHGPALLTAELHGLFSFWDLVSARVIAELINRRVPRRHIANGSAYLAKELQTERPFAHEHLATVGSGFFAKNGGAWIDAGLSGQQAFENMIVPLLRPIDFNEDHMAARWRPAVGVSIDPAVQAGAPCVEGTRVPTSLIAELVAESTGDTAERRAQVCDDYRLSETQLKQAVEYELFLARQAG